MTSEPAYSWGRVVRDPQAIVPLPEGDFSLPDLLTNLRARYGGSATVLPYGNGRSYGDSNLNPRGVLLDARSRKRHIAFDPASAELTCDAGVLLSDILARHVPNGWFPAVTPGTQFITVGGAIANDVHGKNHHRVGSFGDQVVRLDIQRSDGRCITCSPTENPEWFEATIGGMGLTGLITTATIRLRRIANTFVDSETIRFRSLAEFFALSAESESTHEYAVAWIDCAFSDGRLGRGLFSRANHAEAASSGAALTGDRPRRPLRVPFVPPFSLVNALTLKAFNTAYFHRQRPDRVRSLQHYRPFFYPLDSILDWNRIYGPRGFYQYQCAVPPEGAEYQVQRLLKAVAQSGMGSFLAVLKTFGNRMPRGMLSFPMPGTTLALDFPNRGPRLLRLFEALDRLVLEAGGRLYPAKDGRMSPHVFSAGYPRMTEFERFVDPMFSSGLWRRVTARD